MTDTRGLYLIGCASGAAGMGTGSGDGPLAIQQSLFLAALMKEQAALQWDAMVHPPGMSSLGAEGQVQIICKELAEKVSSCIRQQKYPVVIGGDHSCAIGTWSGVYDAIHTKGDFGLIWIDAHMDSHVPETSPSGHIHGMPLACLLGHGMATLTTIFHAAPKIKPENLCLIGVRSYEPGEADLLKRLNVRTYFMEEINERGLKAVMYEAVNLVNRNTIGYGLTLDLDALDPKEAPGVDVPEANGIHAHEFGELLREIAFDPRLIATEIVEFDPHRDIDQKTEKLVVSFLEILAKR